MNAPTYRINRQANAWTLETRKSTRDTWKPFEGSKRYTRLSDAAKRLLDELMAQLVPKGGWSGSDLRDALEIAEQRTLEAVADAAREEAETRILDMIRSIEQDNGHADDVSAYVPDITTKEADAIRKAASPSLAYVNIMQAKRFKRTSDEMARGISPDEAALERVRDL